MNTLTKGDIFINQEIPQEIRMLFPKQFQAAYEAVNDLIATTPFLQCPPAKMVKGHLISWAVDFSVSKLIESGQWNVDFEWAYYAKPTGKYLRVVTKNAVVTVSQIKDPSEQPRQADFRDNAAYDNQPSLFLLPGEKQIITAGKPHLLLIHGHKQLEFIHAAMPNPEPGRIWLGRTKNLLAELHDVSAELTPIEGPETTPAPTIIKEALKKQINEHGI